MPYRINGSEGANKRPKLPELVTSPRLNLSEKPTLTSAGYNSAPIATMVTPDAPVKAVKKAQVTNAMTPSPPGSQPIAACAVRTSRCEALLSASR